MKSKFIIATLFAASFFYACNKSDSNATQPAAGGGTGAAQQNSGTHGGFAAKTNQEGYSSSISLDTANMMIQSYLTSVRFPNQDTALRCLYFDADTLRAYLSDSRITTVKFVLAHQQGYVNSVTYGKYIGMKPGAITMIIAGVDDNNTLIKNTKGGVYEHCLPCPTVCPEGVSDGLLH